MAKYSDIDINGHVNSIRYIEHILDLFPIEMYRERRIRRFEMAYVAESYYGDELTLFMDDDRWGCLWCGGEKEWQRSGLSF